MMIEINNKSALRDSYTPGYGSGCGCGSRRYYTKDEVDALLAGIIDPDEIEQIINNLFEEYIEEGDLEQLIIDAIAGMYTNEEIDDMLAELEARIKTWVEEQGYLTDIDLTINGTTLHNGDSIDIEGGGGGGNEYIKKNTVPQVVTREFLAVSPDNKITVRLTNTDTGANTDYERYIKRINGIPLITQQKQDDIELPSYSYVDGKFDEMEECCNDVNDAIDYLKDKITELEDIISQITGDTPSPDPGPDTGDTRARIIVTYNVTSTTVPTQILYTTGEYLNEIRDANRNEVPISLYYTFPSLGEQTLTFYYSRNTYSDSSQWKGLKQVKKAQAIIMSPGTSAFEGSSLQELHSRNGASYAYRNCTQLVSVAFADGWGSVQSAEFDGCTSLVSDFVVSNKGEKIYQNAFRNTKITSLTIASTVKWISPCLSGCQYLQYVRFLGVTPPETIKSGAFDGSYPIYVPSSAVNTYKTALPNYASRIQAWTGQ